KMEESEDEQTKKTKLQQEQDRLGHEAVEEWENIRARVEADEELTQRLQAEERNKYSEVDQANMLIDLINQRKKYFAAQKDEAKRNKPMTQAQQRNYMTNYIKHMGSHTLQQLRGYSFDEIKELFETTMKKVGNWYGYMKMDKRKDKTDTNEHENERGRKIQSRRRSRLLWTNPSRLGGPGQPNS
ncbi:hypothetical protein Tco_1059264, partial [Tanacetum coccineum]